VNYQAAVPCVVCGKSGAGMVCYHHVYTRKAYPEFSDETWNLIPVCLWHHNEAHRIGNVSMARKYESFNNWLIQNGWEIRSGKLLH